MCVSSHKPNRHTRDRWFHKAHTSEAHFPTTDHLKGTKLKAKEVMVFRRIEELTILQVTYCTKS